MNWLAHFLLAEATHTSLCGQFLGDWVKGQNLSRFDPAIVHGIRLHRAIDRISESQPEYHELKSCFSPMFRRYASILIDVGFDYSLARNWQGYSDVRLSEYTHAVEHHLIRHWPTNAPFPARRLRGLSGIMAAYDSPDGIRRVLAGIDDRLSRPPPLVRAFEELESLTSMLDARLDSLWTRVQHQALTESIELKAGFCCSRL